MKKYFSLLVIVLMIAGFSSLFSQVGSELQEGSQGSSQVGKKEAQTLWMPSIFSDNMVVQRETEIPLWGKGIPGMNIKIEASWGEKGSAVVNPEGKWEAKIKTLKAGGPFTISVVMGNETINYKNVLSGEVWVCSGQSNMEMPLSGWPPKDLIEEGTEAIENSASNTIRLFEVTKAYSTKKEDDCKGTWQEANPETTPSFSATAYFFGKKLFDELKVPIGLIHTSWGGTRIESWISADALSKMDKYKNFQKILDESNEGYTKLMKWLEGHKTIDVSGKPELEKFVNLDFDDSECAESDYDDSDWLSINLPTGWENSKIGNYDGVIWFRKKIEIPNEWVGKELVLELGPIDDMDVTYVNGVKVGAYETGGYWQTPRVYTVPKDVAKSNIITIATRVIDNKGGGGIYGQNEMLKIYKKDGGDPIFIAGEWNYLPVAEYLGGRFFVFNAKNGDYLDAPKSEINISEQAPTVLYNAMIAPLVPYKIKGAIWYQGESNVGNFAEYPQLMSIMINNWRNEFKSGEFPFYYTQIAPYRYREGTNSQYLREAQLKSLSIPKAGMAVTMDIGNIENIHPGNKKSVGDRLAAWALNKDYKINVPYSGPIYKEQRIEGNKVILSFDYGRGLEIKPINGKNNFQIAGANKVFYDADVKINGDELIISSKEVAEPMSVRYCWSDILEGTLFNQDRLPAPSFRTDSW
ncbi:MAG: sialate O-acetylesterase [Melioribacteraceae bacterium]